MVSLYLKTVKIGCKKGTDLWEGKNAGEETTKNHPLPVSSLK